jgi:hypothetical protein
MRKISMFATALIAICVAVWAFASTPPVAAPTSDVIDPSRMQMMTDAKKLPTAHYADYTFVFD